MTDEELEKLVLENQKNFGNDIVSAIMPELVFFGIMALGFFGFVALVLFCG